MLTSKSNLTLLIVAGVLVLIGGGMLAWTKLATAPIAVPCTLEAKICPDGSAVGRSGPKCEFAECPVATSTCTSPEGCAPATSTLATKVDSIQNLEYQYAPTLPTTYIQTQDWPPTVTAKAASFTCVGEPASTTTYEVVASERTISERRYCVKTSIGAAAGSTYTTYGYSTLKNSRLVTIGFTLRATQCANYEEPQQAACTAERQAFNPDSLVESIVASLKFGPDKSDLIKVETPQAGQAITSPLVIKGQARGSWYFEAVFPIVLRDAAGQEVARAQGHATGDWMTTDFVPFEATLTFTAPTTATGTLVFEKDNPSGLPENDDQLVIPVSF
jgi:hypothetical protein